MDNNEVELVGGPCGQHGPYTFYKAFRYSKNGVKRVMSLSEFFFVKLWMDSDLVCIGELQLLWIDKNSDQVLASLRLYFLPENTPEGRMDHGEDEVLAISEKVVLRVEDLVTWITADAEWTWGRLAKCVDNSRDCKKDFDNDNLSTNAVPLTEGSLDFSDVEKEKKLLDIKEMRSSSVIILSYPRYCRYRSIMKRVEGVEDEYLRNRILSALGGFTVRHENTRVLFCRDTFDYPELEGHELLCNHLAPKLKGRPRGKRKKRSLSPGSESNESESSFNSYSVTRSKANSESSSTFDCRISPRRSTRSTENNEGKDFIKKLYAFMKSNRTPIGRIPSLGYKELDLYAFYTKVQKIGGYDSVTANRLWKSIFDDLVGNHTSTSAATVIRRHYERLLLAYERHVKGEEYKPLPVFERRRLKSKTGSSSASDAETSESTSRSGTSTPTPNAPSTSATASYSCTPQPSTSSSDKETTNKSEPKPSALRSVRVKAERSKDASHAADGDNPLPQAQQTDGNDTTASSDTEEMSPASVTPATTPIETSSCTTPPIDVTPTLTETSPTPTDSTIAFTPITSTLAPASNSTVSPAVVALPNAPSSAVAMDESQRSAAIGNTLSENAVTPKTDLKEDQVPSTAVLETTTDLDAKATEPVTSAVAPFQPTSPDKSLSPVEGKENVPTRNASDPVEAKSSEGDGIVEVPYKPKTPEVIDLETDTYKTITASNGNHLLNDANALRPNANALAAMTPYPPYVEVKKRKLDILKEGGLEVTPVNNVMSHVESSRPSVIQENNVPSAPYPNSTDKRFMPPPSIHATLIKKPHVNPITPANTKFVPPPSVVNAKSKPPSTNIVNNNHTVYSYMNGTSPPRVLQSKSIYSPSEKTVYGNPKDCFGPSMLFPPVQTPRFASNAYHRQTGGDILDLTVKSPQKPAVDVTHLPPNSNTFAPAAHPWNLSKESYKKPQYPLLDGQRVGSNLEITLVRTPNQERAQPQLYNYPCRNAPMAPQPPPTPTNHYAKPAKKRTYSEGYASPKMPRLADHNVPRHNNAVANNNNYHHQHAYAPQRDRSASNPDINIPNPYANKLIEKSESFNRINNNLNNNSNHIANNNSTNNNLNNNSKHHGNNVNMTVQNPSKHHNSMPPVMSNLLQMPSAPANKSIPPYVPMLDPYYYSALQNLYSPHLNHPMPTLLPTAEQLQFYNDLLAHNSRVRVPFQYPHDGSSSITTSAPSATNFNGINHNK